MKHICATLGIAAPIHGVMAWGRANRGSSATVLTYEQNDASGPRPWDTQSWTSGGTYAHKLIGTRTDPAEGTEWTLQDLTDYEFGVANTDGVTASAPTDNPIPRAGGRTVASRRGAS